MNRFLSFALAVLILLIVSYASIIIYVLVSPPLSPETLYGLGALIGMSFFFLGLPTVALVVGFSLFSAVILASGFLGNSPKQP